MTEEELIVDFERKAQRYLKAVANAEAEGILPPCAHDYYNVALKLGADLLLRMISAHRERPQLLDRVERLKDQIESKSHEAAALAVLHERAEAELVGLRAQIEAAIAGKGGAA